MQRQKAPAVTDTSNGDAAQPPGESAVSARCRVPVDQCRGGAVRCLQTISPRGSNADGNEGGAAINDACRQRRGEPAVPALYLIVSAEPATATEANSGPDATTAAIPYMHLERLQRESAAELLLTPRVHRDVRRGLVAEVDGGGVADVGQEQAGHLRVSHACNDPRLPICL